MNYNDNPILQFGLAPNTAKNLSNSTISVPMMEAITPRWLLTFLPWVSVESGIYRLNKVKKFNELMDGEGDLREKLPELVSSNMGEHEIPQTFPDYEEKPREYTLSLVQTILRVNVQVTDIFNSPINQLQLKYL